MYVWPRIPCPRLALLRFVNLFKACRVKARHFVLEMSTDFPVPELILQSTLLPDIENQPSLPLGQLYDIGISDVRLFAFETLNV